MKNEKIKNSENNSTAAIKISILLGAISVAMALGNYIYRYVLQFKEYLIPDRKFWDVVDYIFFDAGVDYSDYMLHKLAFIPLIIGFVILNIYFLVKAEPKHRISYAVCRVIEIVAGIFQYIFCEKQNLSFPNAKVIIAASVIILAEVVILFILCSVESCTKLYIAFAIGLLSINILNAVYYLICFAAFLLVCILMYFIASILVPTPYKVTDAFDSMGNYLGKWIG